LHYINTYIHAKKTKREYCAKIAHSYKQKQTILCDLLTISKANYCSHAEEARRMEPRTRRKARSYIPEKTGSKAGTDQAYPEGTQGRQKKRI
jgi:hypothetical protein